MRTALRKLFPLVMRHSSWILLAVIIAAFSLHSSRFFEWESALNIAKQASYLGIVATGMTLVLLTAGIDLSVGSNMYLSAVVGGWLLSEAGAPLPAALAGCLGVGLLFGLFNAVAVTRLGILPFVVTLATLVAGRGLGLWITQSQPVSFPDAVLEIGSARLFGALPLPIAIFALVAMAAHVFLTRTQTGRQLYAVGRDLEAARRAGIPTRRIRALAYVACGGLAALGGFIAVAQYGNVNAGFGKNCELSAITAAVLGGTSLFGGTGSVLPGTVLGVILIQAVTTGLVSARIDLYLQDLILPAIIFAIVLLDSIRARLRGPSRTLRRRA
ncbi:MAG: ABC transporter permease [Planctomycetes bacterium]|nr:ABC transporter permease [Planctomycetota bacterium]